MTKVILALAMFGMIQSQALAATEAATEQLISKNRFSVNMEPIWLAIGGTGIKFEYFASEKVSIGIGGLYIGNHRVEPSVSDGGSSSSSSSYSYVLSHNNINVGTNIMLSGNLNTSGAYLNPALGYQSTSISDFGTYQLSGSLSTPMARLTAGYQWILGQNFRMAVGGGLNVVESGTVVVKDKDGKEVLKDSSTSSGGLALDFQVGFLF